MTPPNLSLIFVMICFWVTLWIVQKFLIRPVGASLNERRHRVDDAQQLWTAKNEDYLASIAHIEERLAVAAKDAAVVRAEARQQAMDARQQALQNVRNQADERLAGVLKTLENESEVVRGDLRQRAEELARLLAGRLLGRELSS